MSDSKTPETNNFRGDFVHYEALLSRGEGVREFFEDLLEGKPLVDLGCGPRGEENGKVCPRNGRFKVYRRR